MVDLTTISAAVGSLKAATEIAKFIKDSDISLEKAELKLKLADLISALADARIEMATLQEGMAAREQQIRDLEAKLKGAQALSFDGAVYWQADDAGGRDGPFCQRCHDADSKRVRLQPGQNSGTWYCRQCKAGYHSRSR
ncbi:hypothetical protein HZ992_14750 [Rhizobacter sp. AJA081-3]|uniref:hypothetical protein n=1 Tax=Rhizobacter sp. AJA081-3 TaxID=2753607 RepID=UPI001ADFAFEB|nr:hypothetical protein [Rhizobacter sp. AJA081-3]QTN21443.1 hypothetical protein HZ992_14750 [Rhizobacter sp. AJA081-3]